MCWESKRLRNIYPIRERGTEAVRLGEENKSLQRCIVCESEPLHGVGEATLMYITCTPRYAPLWAMSSWVFFSYCALKIASVFDRGPEIGRGYHLYKKGLRFWENLDVLLGIDMNQGQYLVFVLLVVFGHVWWFYTHVCVFPAFSQGFLHW